MTGGRVTMVGVTPFGKLSPLRAFIPKNIDYFPNKEINKALIITTR
jgi:hypothetical protein